MKIGLVGPSYQDRSLPFDAQRTVNLFPVLGESRESAEVAALRGTPGLALFGTCGDGPIRGGFESENDRAFVISYDTLYEISSNGTATSRGTLDSATSNCTMDENGLQLAISDGADLYIFTYATNAFAKVTDVDFPGAATVCFIDGYFAYNDPGTGAFYISAAYDGLNVDALDFATAEGAPDDLIRVFQAQSQLLLFGRRTIEVWYNSGDAQFPFSRVSGAKIETGCAAAHSIASIDNSVFWIGRDKDGQGIVYRMQGFSPQRISTHAIEKILQAVSDISVLRAYTYQQEGHAFYVITGSDLETTLVFDASTQLWHERAFLNTLGEYEQHRGAVGFFAFGKTLIGDRENGKVYTMSLDIFSDFGNEIKRERTFSHLIDENTRTRLNELEVFFESGVGLINDSVSQVIGDDGTVYYSGQGVTPTVTLYMSDDGGRTWSNGYQAGIGEIGNYKTRAVWRRLGVASQMTFKISTTDPVKINIIGAYLK